MNSSIHRISLDIHQCAVKASSSAWLQWLDLIRSGPNSQIQGLLTILSHFLDSIEIGLYSVYLQFLFGLYSGPFLLLAAALESSNCFGILD